MQRPKPNPFKPRSQLQPTDYPDEYEMDYVAIREENIDDLDLEIEAQEQEAVELIRSKQYEMSIKENGFNAMLEA